MFRETVRDRIKSIALDPHIKDRYDMYAGMVIDDLEHALLSDEVVEAAVMGMGNCMREHGTVVYESNRMPQPRDLARAVLQSALAAAMRSNHDVDR